MASHSTQRWSRFSLVVVLVAVLALLITPGSSWSPNSQNGRLVRPVAMATNSPLFAQPLTRRRSWSVLYSSEKEDSEGTEATPPSTSELTEKADKDEEEEEKFGVVKTILLAGPLFIKFTIVLL